MCISIPFFCSFGAIVMFVVDGLKLAQDFWIMQIDGVHVCAEAKTLTPLLS